MAEILNLKVKTGVVEVPITDELDREIGRFAFNPSDFGIVGRANAAVEQANAAIDEFSKTDGAAGIEDFESAICGILNTLLDIDNAKEAIFSHCSPLSPNADGQLYFESIFEGILSLIESEFGKRVNKKIKKIQKATSKYHAKSAAAPVLFAMA